MPLSTHSPPVVGVCTTIQHETHHLHGRRKAQRLSSSKLVIICLAWEDTPNANICMAAYRSYLYC